MTDINKVAVIGAGVMGSGIAAQVANAGISVVLLDIVPDGADNRNQFAESAIQKMMKTKPAPFMHKRFAKRITPGNLEDHMDLLKDCDWVCEAIIENLDIKRALYSKLDAVRKPGSIVTSNTSTIPLEKLVEGQSNDFKKDFAITHFFNPPRYMRLLEIVGAKETRVDAVEALVNFGDIKLGKEVVRRKDTPGFIGNRIGILWSLVATSKAYDLGLTVEEADAIVGKPMGVPKTGIFGLADLTGLDLGPYVSRSMASLLPKSDSFHQLYDPQHGLAKLIDRLVAEGSTGRKGKGGFYRINKANGRKIKEAIDLQSGEYRATQKATLKSIKAARKGGLKALLEVGDKGSDYAWQVLAHTLSYAASLVPEISDDIVSVDLALKTGYAWKFGPFELIDQLGSDYLAEKLAADGMPVPELLQKAAGRPFYKQQDEQKMALNVSGDYQPIIVPENAWTLADKKRGREPIAKNGSASLWDVGDGVVCLEFHSKMNAIDADIVDMVKRAARLDKEGYKGVIIGNDADNFSVGANIGLALFAANIGMWPLLEQGQADGQKAFMDLKYSKLPVVAAPAGMALGGGCEVVLHADAVQAHAESYMGLVEAGVGLIPGWGGTKELVMRAMSNKKRPGGPMPALAPIFEAISTAKVSTSAFEARDQLILRHTDGVTMNRRRVLADAKARVLAMVEAGYSPPEPELVRLPGATAKAAFMLAVGDFLLSGKATPHDAVVSEALAEVVSGGDTDVTQELSEKDLLVLERASFQSLIKTGPTLDRIEHMLTTGKPLRN